jgi:hypothetical protein
MHVLNELVETFTAAQFADQCPSKGQPAASLGLLGPELILQDWEGLTDRQAGDPARRGLTMNMLLFWN